MSGFSKIQIIGFWKNIVRGPKIVCLRMPHYMYYTIKLFYRTGRAGDNFSPRLKGATIFSWGGGREREFF